MHLLFAIQDIIRCGFILNTYAVFEKFYLRTGLEQQLLTNNVGPNIEDKETMLFLEFLLLLSVINSYFKQEDQ